MQQPISKTSCSLIEQTHKQIRKFLSENTQLSEGQLQTFLRQKLQPSLQSQPQFYLNQIEQLESLKQPVIVSAQLMVHDIRDEGYYTPYLIQTPFSQTSDIQILKFGNCSNKHQSEQILQKFDNESYFRFLLQRQVIACTPVLHQTQWCRKVQENKLKPLQNIDVIMDSRCVFKLGQTINIIGLWRPQQKKIYFIRNTASQKLSDNLLTKYLSLQVKNFSQTRKQILSLLSKFMSEKYAHFVLYSFLSKNSFFISGQWNIQKIARILLPRVNSVPIKAPFEKSLFPYKNQEEIIVNSPMEMSSNHTYTILDFSGLSQDKQIKITQAEIDNLKALKVFVEQSQTIYRWLYGQSLISHTHTGMVVKASSIVNPNFIIKGQTQFDVTKVQELISQIGEDKLHQFRAYIHQARLLEPFINEQSRKYIQSHMHENIKLFEQNSIHQVMELSKLNAQSFGRGNTLYEDYINASKLFFGEQTLLIHTAQFKKKSQSQIKTEDKLSKEELPEQSKKQ